MEKYDVIFSLGPNCQPAYYLKLCNLRKCAYPLDWQIYSIETALHLYKTKFEDFFLEYKEKEEDNLIENIRCVLDTKNNIISMHHIRSDIPLNKAVSIFKDKMLKRYNRLDSDLKKAKNILLVSNYEHKLLTFVNFLIQFSQIYTNKKITLVNVYSTKKYEYELTYKINDNTKFIQYSFNNVNKYGTDKNNNQLWWVGNSEKWVKMLHTVAIK